MLVSARMNGKKIRLGYAENERDVDYLLDRFASKYGAEYLGSIGAEIIIEE